MSGVLSTGAAARPPGMSESVRAVPPRMGEELLSGCPAVGAAGRAAPVRASERTATSAQARGGGGSRVRVTECGSSERSGRAGSAACEKLGGSSTAKARTAGVEQVAINEHPAGVCGGCDGAGDVICGGSGPAAVRPPEPAPRAAPCVAGCAWCGAPARCCAVAAAPAACVSRGAGMAQSDPPPSTMDWRKARLSSSASRGRRRGMGTRKLAGGRGGCTPRAQRLCLYMSSTSSSYIALASSSLERMALAAQCLRWLRINSRPTARSASWTEEICVMMSAQ